MFTLTVGTQMTGMPVTFLDAEQKDDTQNVLNNETPSVTVDNASIISAALTPGTGTDAGGNPIKTLSLTVNALAAGTGNATVATTNPDGTTASLAVAFTVNAAFDDATQVNVGAGTIQPIPPATPAAKK